MEVRLCISNLFDSVLVVNSLAIMYHLVLAIYLVITSDYFLCSILHDTVTSPSSKLVIMFPISFSQIAESTSTSFSCPVLVCDVWYSGTFSIGFDSIMGQAFTSLNFIVPTCHSLLQIQFEREVYQVFLVWSPYLWSMMPL